MDNAVYIALSRQMALFRDLDMTANNIANANTTGFQAEKMSFEQYLVKGGMTKQDKMAFVRDRGSYMVEAKGSMKVTGNPLDVALEGNAYFSVKNATGDALHPQRLFPDQPGGDAGERGWLPGAG